MSIILAFKLKMDVYPTKFKALLPVIALGAMILSAGAQQSGQSIIFSSPQNAGAQTGTSSLTPDTSQPGILPGTLQAPVQFFDFTPPSATLPPPTPSADASQQRRMKQLLEEKKNWILMTPEEILGATSSGKMYQPSELDALGREKKMTQMERYMERERQLQASFTNNWQSDRTASSRNFSRDLDAANSLDSRWGNTLVAAPKFGQFLSGQGNQYEVSVQKENSGWAALNQSFSKNTSKPDLEQLAAMERFRQLLNSSSPGSPQPASDSKFFTVLKPVVDPFMTQPEFVPNPSASFMPVTSGLSKPAGLTPLPSVTTSFSVPAPIGKPLPSWLLQGPQPFVMPQQRKF